jgi:hypothetical protein
MTQPPQAAARFGSIVGTRPCVIIHLHYIIRRAAPFTMTALNCSCMPPHFRITRYLTYFSVPPDTIMNMTSCLRTCLYFLR